MRSTVTVRLLGRFSLCFDGEAVRLDATRAELLFAYLVLHPEAQTRRRLAAALWPDSTEAQAHTNLRKLLHTLRRTLPDVDEHLEITPRTVRWRGESDVAAFERLLTSRPPRCGRALRRRPAGRARRLLAGGRATPVARALARRAG